jgi:hypothetical protein
MLYLPLIILSLELTGCGIDTVIPLGEKNKPQPPRPQESTLPAPETKTAQKLKISRMIRRITLEITGNLPPTKIIEKITQNPENFIPWVEHLMERELAQTLFADTFNQVWSLDRTPAFDLYSIAREDPTFTPTLNESFLELLKEEPTQIVKKIVTQDSPFSSILKLNYSIAHGELLKMYDRVLDKIQISAPYYSFSYDDVRPKNSGILFTNGWLASFSNYGDPFGQKRGYKLRKALLCDAMDSANSHLFRDLSETELQSNLVEISNSKESCFNCHLPILETSSLFQGIAEGKTWKEWSTQSPQSPLNQPEYIAKIENFINETSLNPRFFRCQVERITSIIFQIPFNFSFQNGTSKSIDALAENQQNLRKSLLSILRSNEYFIEPTTSNLNSKANLSLDEKNKVGKSDTSQTTSPTQKDTNPSGTTLQEISGLRVLRKDQWKRVLAQLSPIAFQLQYPNDLNPDFQNDSELDDSLMIPQYPYWSAVEKLVHDFAYQVVKYELSTEIYPKGMRALDRHVFSLLPDDINLSNPDQITEQIKLIWILITSEQIDNNADILLNLVNFWKSVKSQTENSPQKKESGIIAWRSLLIIILTHPHFFTY